MDVRGMDLADAADVDVFCVEESVPLWYAFVIDLLTLLHDGFMVGDLGENSRVDSDSLSEILAICDPKSSSSLPVSEELLVLPGFDW
jgi:hypothetical protein